MSLKSNFAFLNLLVDEDLNLEFQNLDKLVSLEKLPTPRFGLFSRYAGGGHQRLLPPLGFTNIQVSSLCRVKSIDILNVNLYFSSLTLPGILNNRLEMVFSYQINNLRKISFRSNFK